MWATEKTWSLPTRNLQRPYNMLLVTWTAPKGKVCSIEEINGWGMHQYEIIFFLRAIKHCAIIQVYEKKIKIDHDNHYHKLNLNHNHSHNVHNHKIWHLLILLELFCRVKIICASVQELCKNSVNFFIYFLFYYFFFQAHPLNGAAVYPYESKSPSNLSFQAGDIITLLDAR